MAKFYKRKGGRRGKARKGMRYNKKRYGNKIRQPVQYFKRSVWLPGVLSTSTIGVTPFGLSFSLADLPSNSEFTSLFDQYKIIAVKCKLMPRFNSVDLGLNGGRIHTVLDYDDTSAPASMNDLTQYQNLKTTDVARTHTRYLKPMLNLASQSGAWIPQRAGWVDVATPGAAYRGVKGILDQTSSVVTYDGLFTYYMAFKNVR